MPIVIIINLLKDYKEKYFRIIGIDLYHRIPIIIVVMSIMMEYPKNRDKPFVMQFFIFYSIIHYFQIREVS